MKFIILAIIISLPNLSAFAENKTTSKTGATACMTKSEAAQHAAAAFISDHYGSDEGYNFPSGMHDYFYNQGSGDVNIDGALETFFSTDYFQSEESSFHTFISFGYFELNYREEFIINVSCSGEIEARIFVDHD